MQKLKRQIIVACALPGFHYYQEAPEAVAFLRSPHRHLFHFRVVFDVAHDNRDLEFFIQQRELAKFLRYTFGEPCQFGPLSCEQIAQLILERFVPDGCRQVAVFEDGENGAVVECVE
ncbi:MAG: hypothetical protein MOB07_31535 [Acidobacteria bacterium]|nr:hypothetical protein [Acidobacteriota bacterium]